MSTPLVYSQNVLTPHPSHGREREQDCSPRPGQVLGFIRPPPNVLMFLCFIIVLVPGWKREPWLRYELLSLKDIQTKFWRVDPTELGLR